MSGGHEGPKGVGTRLVQGGVLALLFGILYVATRYFPSISERGGTVAAVGFLLLAGTLMSELVEVIKLPHLTGYIIAGVIAGPHVLHLVSHSSVEDLSVVNSLALALIALAGGAELRMSDLRKGLRSLVWGSLVQTGVVLLGMTLVFFLARPMMPFLAKLDSRAALGVAIMWGVAAVTRSPSATLGILSQTKAQGPLATFTLSFVMASDIVVVVLLAVGLLVARPLIDPTAGFALADLTHLGHELLGSVALGTTIGLVLAAYMRLVGAQLILVLLGLGFGAYEVIRYLQFDALLVFMVAGFVIQNLTAQGPALIHAVERTGGVVFVIFFATAGAHLDLPLVAKLWPVALLLAGARAALTWASGRVAANLADDHPMIRRWGFSGLVSQAGLALGIVVIVEKAFPQIAGFKALGVAAIALNEFFGPVLFKIALDRAGETGAAPLTRASLTSTHEPSPEPSPNPAIAEALTRDSETG